MVSLEVWQLFGRLLCEHRKASLLPSLWHAENVNKRNLVLCCTCGNLFSNCHKTLFTQLISAFCIGTAKSIYQSSKQTLRCNVSTPSTDSPKETGFKTLILPEPTAAPVGTNQVVSAS